MKESPDPKPTRTTYLEEGYRLQSLREWAQKIEDDFLENDIYPLEIINIKNHYVREIENLNRRMYGDQ